MPHSHIIKRNTIELHMARRLDHAELQAQVASIYREKVVPIIEQLLEKHCSGGVSLRIEQLELDLGKISLRFLEAEFLGRFSTQFEAHLLDMLQEEPENRPDPGAAPGGQLQLLQWYLQTGTLPWWATSKEHTTIPESLLDLARTEPQVAAGLLRNAAGQARWMERLIHSLPDHALLRICSLAFGQLAKAAALLVPRLRDLLLQLPERPDVPALRRSIWQGLLGLAQPTGGSTATVEQLTQAVLTAVAEARGLAPRSLAQACLRLQETADRLPPEAVAEIREMAATASAELPAATQAQRALEAARAALQDLLAADGLDLARLAQVAPVMRQIFAHTRDQQLQELLRTLSKFISPFLAPEAQGPGLVARELAPAERLAQAEEVMARLETAEGFGDLGLHTQKALRHLFDLLREWLRMQVVDLVDAPVAEVSAVDRSTSASLSEMSETREMSNSGAPDSAIEALENWLKAQLSRDKKPEVKASLPKQLMHQARRAWLLRSPVQDLPAVSCLVLALDNLVEIREGRARLRGAASALAPLVATAEGLLARGEGARMAPILQGLLEAGDLPEKAWERLREGLADAEQQEWAATVVRHLGLTELEIQLANPASQLAAEVSQPEGRESEPASSEAKPEKYPMPDLPAMRKILASLEGMGSTTPAADWPQVMSVAAMSFLSVLPQAELRPVLTRLSQDLLQQPEQLWLRLQLPAQVRAFREVAETMPPAAAQRFSAFLRMLREQARRAFSAELFAAAPEILQELEEMKLEISEGKTSKMVLEKLVESLLKTGITGGKLKTVHWQNWHAAAFGAAGESGKAAAKQGRELALKMALLQGVWRAVKAGAANENVVGRSAVSRNEVLEEGGMRSWEGELEAWLSDEVIVTKLPDPEMGLPLNPGLNTEEKEGFAGEMDNGSRGKKSLDEAREKKSLVAGVSENEFKVAGEIEKTEGRSSEEETTAELTVRLQKFLRQIYDRLKSAMLDFSVGEISVAAEKLTEADLEKAEMAQGADWEQNRSSGLVESGEEAKFSRPPEEWENDSHSEHTGTMDPAGNVVMGSQTEDAEAPRLENEKINASSSLDAENRSLDGEVKNRENQSGTHENSNPEHEAFHTINSGDPEYKPGKEAISNREKAEFDLTNGIDKENAPRNKKNSNEAHAESLSENTGDAKDQSEKEETSKQENAGSHPANAIHRNNPLENDPNSSTHHDTEADRGTSNSLNAAEAETTETYIPPADPKNDPGNSPERKHKVATEETSTKASAEETAQERRFHKLQNEIRQHIAGLLREVLPPQIRQQLLTLRSTLMGARQKSPGTRLRALADIRKGLDHLSQSLDALLVRDPDPLATEVAEELSDTDALYTGNAGLILLWPFIARFFAKLGLADDRNFVSPEAQQRAVLILEYLVQGETEFAEHMLPLNKLLCGYPLQQPIPLELELDEATVAECQMLLEVVPSHNPMMKNLTADGFRDAWLQREGVLKAKDDHYILHVEGKPYDILLEQIPWALETVKLPWMKDILTVEW